MVYQQVTFTRSVNQPSGSDTSITIDYHEEIKQGHYMPISPSVIISTSTTTTPTITSSSLSGTKVTFNFSGVVDSGNLSVTLGF
jgi:hypothetical protein